jgi:ABC-2 type transporter
MSRHAAARGVVLRRPDRARGARVGPAGDHHRRIRARVLQRGHPHRATLLRMLAMLAVGAAAFCALGFAASSAIPSADASLPIVNVIILPLLFVSGVFIPLGNNPPAWMSGSADLPGQAFPVRDPGRDRGTVPARGQGTQRRRSQPGMAGCATEAKNRSTGPGVYTTAVMLPGPAAWGEAALSSASCIQSGVCRADGRRATMWVLSSSKSV